MSIDAIASQEPERIKPLILCGGSGTRLWPISNDRTPKQLLCLTGAETLFQATVQRVSGELFDNAIIVTSETFAEVIAEQLDKIGLRASKILLEPVARNTAPAIAVAAFSELLNGRDPLLLAMPSDHVIVDETAFANAIRIAAPAAESGEIVTFGVRPRHPETGYGYIEVDGIERGSEVAKVIRFAEKPDAVTAAAYVQSGRHFWNAGIFLFRASTVIRELRQHAPPVAAACERAVRDASVGGTFMKLEGEAFASSPSISLDYAVLEKSDRISMVEADVGWSDIGSWEALWEAGEKDANGNVVFGNAVLIDSRDCLVRNELDCPIAVVDSADLVIVVSAAGSLVLPRQSAQKTKLVAELSGKAQRP